MKHEHQHDGHSCCGHDHHSGHKEHGHEHQHGEGHQCCGHEHHHEKKEAVENAAACCGHEHAPGGDCCAHDHAAGSGCCGHDHSKEAHSGCGHSHSHAHSCCGHDHSAEDEEDAEWTRKFFAFLQGIVLIMIGGVICYFVASGRIDGGNPSAPYVTGWFKGLTLAGGLGLMIMGAFNWLMRNQQPKGCGHEHGECGHDHDDESEDAHLPHHHEGSVAGRAFTLLLLSGSIAAATMLTPDQFSSRHLQFKAEASKGDANSRKGNIPELAAAKAAGAGSEGGFTLAKVEQYLKRTKEGNFPLSVMNLHYMGSDPEYAAVMEGQPVETVGQVVNDQINPGSGHLRVVTMQVTCCAADARPYSIPVVFEGKAPEHVEMGWYVVTGTLEFTRERGMKMARLKGTKLEATLRPADQRPSY